MKKSLFTKMLVSFLIILIVTGSIISYISYRSSVNLAVNQSIDSEKLVLSDVDEMLNMFIKEHEKSLDVYAAKGPGFIDQNGMANRDLINGEFASFHKANPNLLNSYMATNNKEMIIYPNTKLPAGYDPTVKDWYTKAVKADGKIVWQDPYKDIATGKTVITALKVVKKDGQTVGVVGIDIAVDQIFHFITDIKIGKTGYAGIIDKQGTMLIHPQKAMVGKNVSKEDYYKQMVKKGNNGVINYQLNNQAKVMAFTTNSQNGWKIFGTVTKKEFESQASSLIPPILLALLIVSLLAAVITYFIGRGMIQPLKALQKTMSRVEKGDFTVKLESQRQDEIGKLTNTFNTMLSHIKHLVLEVNQSSEQTINAAKMLVTSAEENSAAANEVAVTMDQISSGAMNQSELIEENTQALQHFSEQIVTIEEQSKLVLKDSLSMTEISKNGLEKIAFLEKQSESTLNLNEQMLQVINHLNQRSTEISSIVETIAEIANQTNLLSLNAAIEAARAGENGKGFAVVADEVKKLATQTGEALKEITVLTKQIQAETVRSAAMMETSNSAIQEQNKAVQETENAFRSINQAVEQNSRFISEIADSIETISVQRESITDNMEKITEISQETAAGTQQVSASIEEQSSSMEQLRGLALELETATQNVQKELANFII